jgi:endo-1,4-beta-mannosidase
VRRIAAGKPVVVSEIGQTSFGAFRAFPSSEQTQAEELDTRLAALDGADGVLVWTLHDFDRVDAAAVGASPWAQRLQAAFGLIRADGSEKPAAGAFRAWLAGRG